MSRCKIASEPPSRGLATYAASPTAVLQLEHGIWTDSGLKGVFLESGSSEGHAMNVVHLVLLLTVTVL
ncbi:hypothetical protein GUJ93_ZPchr0009g829 [Zizania palustris]|uniref:Uncharacterized protein n=1 Tax=Zizania palustris TaxID=103762 RepID=A0A8J5RMH3_ZIZPA|nr:hypothetical protein GUJ93_ZPchr0009g829 [Zizania palustris]